MTTLIEIVEYRPEWVAEYQQIAAVLRRALGESAQRIDHVGSTAVPDLCAKNIIDVQVTVQELKRRLAAALSDDNAYPEVKDPAVDLIYFAAEQWAVQSQS